MDGRTASEQLSQSGFQIDHVGIHDILRRHLVRGKRFYLNAERLRFVVISRQTVKYIPLQPIRTAAAPEKGRRIIKHQSITGFIRLRHFLQFIFSLPCARVYKRRVHRSYTHLRSKSVLFRAISSSLAVCIDAVTRKSAVVRRSAV